MKEYILLYNSQVTETECLDVDRLRSFTSRFQFSHSLSEMRVEVHLKLAKQRL